MSSRPAWSTRASFRIGEKCHNLISFMDKEEQDMANPMVDQIPPPHEGFQKWSKFEVMGEEDMRIKDIHINKEKSSMLHKGCLTDHCIAGLRM